MNPTLTDRTEQTCQRLIAAGETVTFPAVAQHSGIARATLYRRPELRAIVEEHRQQTQQPHTLADLATQIDQLRDTLEAVAGNVRRHEDQLRRLKKLQRPS
ncbi:DUF6262 family protein [Nakamurella sp. PAMC28650]|uniref:DUF6262 family protein n=1 Tax=Nakamurella sp. PAMC28650 TaxID=2762325 RepID=UPI00164DBA39|nr:DUF6262 family protein [Nakamurella sp. PAMC28650]QNK80521.1 hypothetical protein H7F38_20505 [Nakamurella sp. PAMC28650]